VRTRVFVLLFSVCLLCVNIAVSMERSSEKVRLPSLFGNCCDNSGQLPGIEQQLGSFGFTYEKRKQELRKIAIERANKLYSGRNSSIRIGMRTFGHVSDGSASEKEFFVAEVVKELEKLNETKIKEICKSIGINREGCKTADFFERIDKGACCKVCNARYKRRSNLCTHLMSHSHRIFLNEPQKHRLSSYLKSNFEILGKLAFQCKKCSGILLRSSDIAALVKKHCRNFCESQCQSKKIVGAKRKRALEYKKNKHEKPDKKRKLD